MHKAKSHKIRNYYCKEDFSRETLVIRKGIWNEDVRLQKEEGKFAVINFDRNLFKKFSIKKTRITGSFHMNKI